MLKKELALFIQTQKKSYYNYKLESKNTLTFEEFIVEKMFENGWEVIRKKDESKNGT